MATCWPTAKYLVLITVWIFILGIHFFQSRWHAQKQTLPSSEENSVAGPSIIITKTPIPLQHANSSSDSSKMKRIVFWTTIYDNDYNYMFPEGQNSLIKQCQKPCEFSRDRSTPEIYDAFIFNTRDDHNAPKYRSPQQVYVAYSDRSPTKQSWKGTTHYAKGNFYNWTISVMRDATIQTTYFNTYNENPIRGKHTYAEFVRKYRLMEQKRKGRELMVLWLVSHCKTESQRKKYVGMLQGHIPVDIYGYCSPKKCPNHDILWTSDTCLRTLYQTGKYKFYLAFENSICKDYISEKAFRPLALGMIPIVMGGMGTEDYVAQLPPNSFIDVRNFTSPKALADYLRLLDKNEGMFLAYQQWRKTHQIVLDHHDRAFYSTWMCKLCNALYDEKFMNKQRMVDWSKYYDPAKHCDYSLVNRLLASSQD